MDVLTALFVLYIIMFIIGVIRRGLLWSFLEMLILLAMFYEGCGITLVLVMLFSTILSIIYTLEGGGGGYD